VKHPPFGTGTPMQQANLISVLRQALKGFYPASVDGDFGAVSEKSLKYAICLSREAFQRRGKVQYFGGGLASVSQRIAIRHRLASNN
jgi:hypothetical protein